MNYRIVRCIKHKGFPYYRVDYEHPSFNNVTMERRDIWSPVVFLNSKEEALSYIQCKQNKPLLIEQVVWEGE